MDELQRIMDIDMAKENPVMEQPMGLSDIIEILNTLDNGNPMNTEQYHNGNELTATNNQLISKNLELNLPKALKSEESHMNDLSRARIRIIEQPANKALRFRYVCEGRSAGSIPGQNSTNENRTYPAIEIEGYRGEVTIVVSCVTKDPPYKQHPHNLVGKEWCEHGICTMRIKGDPPRAVFSNLGIQCVRRKDIKAALELRESRKVDPFKNKFAHKDHPNSIDLNVVRLCFQAFIQIGPRQYKKLTPVVSDPIYDKKAMSDLAICRLCSCSARVSGGDEIIMLCEKLPKDIKIKFFELSPEEEVVWEAYAEFHQTDIHKQSAIAFRTPPYRCSQVPPKAQIFIQLERPSDGATSEPLPFEYYPDPDQLKRKRHKSDGKIMSVLQREEEKMDPTQPQYNDISKDTLKWNLTTTPSASTASGINNLVEIQTDDPGANCTNGNWLTPSYNYGSRRSPFQMSTTPSPQPLSPVNRYNASPSPNSQLKGSHQQIQQPQSSTSTSNYNSSRFDLHVMPEMKHSYQPNELNVGGTGGLLMPTLPTENCNEFITIKNANTSNVESCSNLYQLNGIVKSESGAILQPQQPQPQQPQQFNTPASFPNDLDSLLQIGSDQFINLNSDDLKLSNFSILT